jgi:hypothetical protein
LRFSTCVTSELCCGFAAGFYVNLVWVDHVW